MSPTLAWRAAYLASTRGHGGGSAKATNFSSNVECGEYGWVLTGGVAPLSWRFWGDLVLALASSGILNSSLWEKSNVGQTMVSISPSKTSCIVSSSLVCPSRSGVLAKLVGEFSADST